MRNSTPQPDGSDGVFAPCGRRRAVTWIAVVISVCGLASPAFAASVPLRRALADYFRPVRITDAAMSPDGRLVACVVRDGSLVTLHITGVDGKTPPARIVPGLASPAEAGRDRERAPVAITQLRWLDGGTLLYRVQYRSPRSEEEEVRVANADGSGDRRLIASSDVEFVYSPLPALPALPRAGAAAAAGGEEGGEEAGGQPGGDAPMEDLPSFDIPRALQVVGVREAPERTVFVQALGSDYAPPDLYEIPLATGKPKRVKTPYVKGRLLFDRQMQPRIEEPPRDSFNPDAPRGSGLFREVAVLNEQEFRYRAAEGGRWQALDRYLGGPTLHFRQDDREVFAPGSFPLAFGADTNLLHFASNVGRDTVGIYALDLRTKQRTEFAVESPDFDLAWREQALSEGPLVFDREQRLVGVRLPGERASTRWLEPRLERLQALADREFGQRSVTLLGWDAAFTRALALVSGPADAGRYVTIRAGEPAQITEVARCAPWLSAARLHRAWPVAAEANGTRVTGWVTLPQRVRVSVPPIVVLCRDFPERAASEAFDPDAQALAALGFATLRVYHRGLEGRGARFRDAARAAVDRVPVEDIRALLAVVGERFPVDRRRVAVLGRGAGGYVAIRATQLYPGEFRCAIGIATPLSLPAASVDFDRDRPPPAAVLARQEFFAGGAKVAPPILANLAAQVRPVMLVEDAERSVAGSARGLRERWKKAAAPLEVLELKEELAQPTAEAAAQVFVRIGEFLNEHVYEFGVNIGELTEVR